MTRRIAAVLLALALLSGLAQAASPRVILGVLEETPNLFGGPGKFFKVRMAFVKRGDGWAAICTKAFCPADAEPDPTKESWNAGFSGRRLGSIPPPRTMEPDWVLEGGKVPTVGKSSIAFGGFPGIATHRPLIVSSRPQFTDPDGWKRGEASAPLTEALRAAFRKNFPEVENCGRKNNVDPEIWNYTDADIKVAKFYVSRRGWSIASLSLSPWRCDGPIEDPFDSQLYAISPDGKIRYLDQGIWLVDAGDYDADGKSELVFAIDRYNEAGYALYYADFSRHVGVEFHYH